MYDLRLQAQVPLIQAMEEACDQIDAVAVQGWIRHSRRFFPRCLANEDIACDVDEILWPDPARRRDDALYSIFVFFFQIFFLVLDIMLCLSDSLQCYAVMKTETSLVVFVVILHV